MRTVEFQCLNACEFSHISKQGLNFELKFGFVSDIIFTVLEFAYDFWKQS